MRRVLMIMLIFTSCFNCSYFNAAGRSGASSDEESVAAALSRPERQFENYAFNPELDFHQRISAPPDFVMKYIRELDQKEYTSLRLSGSQIKIVEEALNHVPVLLRRMLKEKVVGVYFINDLMGSGMTDWLVDKNKNIYCIMFFNPVTLKMNMSEWLTYKEKTCFIKDTADDDILINAGTSYGAFLGILLHEAVHVADYVMNITPYVEEATRALSVVKGEKITRTPFVRGTWREISIPENDLDFKKRRDVSFYGFSGGPKIKISEAEDLYRGLAGSPFTSIYGSMSWAEDLCEYLLFYHLTEKLKQPYIISVIKNKSVIYTLEPMKDVLVKKRPVFMEQFYK